jgi:hypothetical protein
MTASRPSSARRTGAVRILSLLVLSGCAAETPVSGPVQEPNFAKGGGSGPTVRAADPDSGLRNTTIDVRVLGSGFDNGSKAIWAIDGDTAFATTKITTHSTRFVRSGELVANITIAADAPLALFDIVVVTAGGKKGIGIEKFAVKQGQTFYSFTFEQGLQSDPVHPFSGAAKTGDPFYGGVSGNPVYLTLPASAGGDDLAVCDGDGSLGPSTASWGAYAGVWKGSFSIGAKGQGPQYHVSFGATREDGTGSMWLVINGDGVKSNGNLTLTFTNVRGLLNVSSTPDGGAYDPQDRCLTFSISATP